ncbi:MAG TPA: recombinase family protein, partial [Candidatus Obscuribacterales bacterium]
MSTVAYAYIDPYGDAAVTEASFGQPVDRLYVDQRLEGGDRPALQTLLQACATQPPTTLLVRELGELGATLTAVFDTVQTLEAHGVRVATLDDSYGTASEATAGEGRDRLLALADRVQAQHRRQQLQAGHARNRVSLLPPPGRAPYGYRRGRYRYALDRATAPAVKAFFEHFILYGSIRGAARFLEKNYGKRIAASTAQRWLLHPVYRGDLLYKDGRVIRDTHTPIIAREEAAQVDRLLRRNRKLPPKTVSAGRSLAGLVQCAECQSQLKVSRVTRPRQAREYLYLRPIACGRAKPCKAIAKDAVLDQTVATICAEL